MEEHWLPVVGYEGLYEVSDLGRVKNVAARKGTYPGRILPAFPDRYGRPQLKLYIGNQQSKTVRVHTLVAKAFIPIPPEFINAPKIEVNHKDLDKANCVKDNLEWMTPMQNSQHAAANGVAPAAKLTPQNVKEIRAILSRNVCLIYEIADAFKVTRKTIQNIKYKRTYKML